jgi:hypothetical protein
MPDVPASLFTDFAELEARGVSPLYDRLARAVAMRRHLRRMIGAAAPQQRRATLFFAAIHDLVLDQGVIFPEDGPDLEAFCAANEAAIMARIAVRRTQTNEVARSAQLVPALAAVTALAEGPPSVLEVGSSAGLNLRFDAYRYTYRTADRSVNLGDVGAPVHIDCAFEGDVGAIPATLPAVGERIGLDTEPVDLDDPQQVRWLRACVWADETGRDLRLQAAIEQARRDPPVVIRGDAIADLDRAADQLPPDAPLVVVHQSVMGYLSTRDRTRFGQAVRALARRRPVYWLFAESPTAAQVLAAVTPPSGDGAQHVLVLADLTRDPTPASVLAVADPHGQWLHWLAPVIRRA